MYYLLNYSVKHTICWSLLNPTAIQSPFPLNSNSTLLEFVALYVIKKSQFSLVEQEAGDAKQPFTSPQPTALN